MALPIAIGEHHVLRSCHTQVRSPFGLLALAYVGKRLPLQVLRSAAGHYIGTFDDGPASRESVEYFPSHEAAPAMLWKPVQGRSASARDPHPRIIRRASS